MGLISQKLKRERH